VSAGQVQVTKAGVTTTAVSVGEERIKYSTRALPDILAYLQNETELTRSTLVRILKESGRLSEVFNNPQRFLDQIAAILKYELHRAFTIAQLLGHSDIRVTMRYVRTVEESKRAAVNAVQLNSRTNVQVLASWQKEPPVSAAVSH
jgi:restriction endonuclease